MVTIATMERRGTFPVKHTAVKGVTELQQPDGWFLLVPDQTRRCCDDAAFFEVHEYVHTYVDDVISNIFLRNVSFVRNRRIECIRLRWWWALPTEIR